jgi:6,7-dimethyl-8-ribityllumazine synthase
MFNYQNYDLIEKLSTGGAPPPTIVVPLQLFRRQTLMATRALQQVLTYVAWNTSTNTYATGDFANHTLSWVKDGTRAAPTNAATASEIDATNLPGRYKCTMTSTETDCIEGLLDGKSSTTNVILIGVPVSFDYLNTSAPATAGIPDVNVKNMNNVAATSITTINANQGTTQPVNFTGTAGTALVKGDTVDIAGAAVSTSTAQIGVNVVTNGDKTGYTASTVSDKTGYSLAAGQKVDVDTIKTNPVVNAGTVTFPTNSTLASTTNITAGTITTATNLTNAPTAGDLTSTMKTSVENAVWNATMASHLTAGTTGLALNSAGSAGDPWNTAIPGAYGVGTAGHRLGNIPDVTAGSAGGVFIAGSNAATTVNLTGNLSGSVGSVTGAVGSVTGGVTVTTNNDKTGYTASTVSDKTGYSLAAGQKVDVDTIKTNPVVNAGTVTFPTNSTLASTSNITGGTITTTTNLTNAPTAGDLTSTMKTSVENAVWNAPIASHLTAGSTGQALAASGSAGDPWSTPIPGAYASGTAGHRLGNVPDVAAGSAGGVFIAGSNAATTVNLTGNLSGSVGSVTGGVTVTTNNDKTGYTASTVSDKTGYSLTQAFPANFSSLGITAGGHITNTDTVTNGVTVTTNNDKTGYTASTVSDKTGYALTAGERTSIADALLDRNMASGVDSGSPTVRTPRQALRFLRNKWSMSANDLTVCKEDDTTASWTSTVTTNAAAVPVTGNDPA